MKRAHWIGAAICGSLMFIGWLLTGEPIFESGHAAVGCYFMTLCAVMVGAAAGQLYLINAAEINARNAQPKSNDFAFKCIDDHTKIIGELGDRLSSLEKRVSGISVVAGIRPKSVQETRS